MRYAVLALAFVSSFCEGWVPSVGTWRKCRVRETSPAALLRFRRADSAPPPRLAYRLPAFDMVAGLSMVESTWENLGGGAHGNAVCKRVLEAGSGKMPEKGCEVQVLHTVTFEWAAHQCFLPCVRPSRIQKCCYISFPLLLVIIAK